MADPHSDNPRRLSLRANFSWTLLGNIVYSGCQWAMIVLLAKLGTTAAVGQFAYGLAVTAPVFMFSGLNLRSVLATDARGRFAPGTYIALRVIATGLALAFVIALSLLVVPDTKTGGVVLAVGASKAFEALSDVLYGTMQRHERMDLIGRSMILKGMASIAAFAAALLVFRDVLAATIALALAWLVILVTFDAPVTARLSARAGETAMHSLRPEWARTSLAGLARTAAPLGVVALLISLNTNVPRYFLEHYAGVGDLGVFAALSYLMVAGGTVVGAMGQAASPRLAILFAAMDSAGFRRLVRRLLVLAGLIGLAGVLVALVAGRPILLLLYRPEYAAQAPVFTWIAIASAVSFLASILGYSMTAAQVFDAQAPLFVAVSGATAAASLWLIPRAGLLGAAWALILGNSVQLGGAAYLLVRRIQTAPRPARAAGDEAPDPLS